MFRGWSSLHAWLSEAKIDIRALSLSSCCASKMRVGIVLRKSSSQASRRHAATSSQPLGGAAKRSAKKGRRNTSQYLQARSRHYCTDVAMDVDGVHAAREAYRSNWTILNSDEIDGGTPASDDVTPSAADLMEDIPPEDGNPAWADDDREVPQTQAPSKKKRSRVPDDKKIRLYTRWDQLLPLLRIPLASYLAGNSTHNPVERCGVAGCCLRTREVVCVFWKRERSFSFVRVFANRL